MIAFFYSFFVSAQKSDTSQKYIPSEENLIAREWFKEAKFGLFIHWGVYSILGDGEWVMHNQKIAKDAYEKLPSFFNPIEFNAVEWVQIAKKAGMKYITVTSRHHDGFSMFDTNASDYNIVKKTPYKKDIIKDLYLDKDTATINTEFTLEDGRKSKISATMEIRHLIKTSNTKSKKPTSTAKKSSKGKK
mgnify:CR=1 FL=1